MTPQEQIDFIIGPQLTTGDYFDQTLLAQAKKYGELFPAIPPPPDQMDAYIQMNYYDLGRSEYVAFQRTKDEVFRTYGRKVADSWFKCSYFKEGTERNPDNNTSPKFSGLVGLILRAIDGRPDMWDAINYWTRYYFDLWILRRMDGTYKDIHIREGAFALQFAIYLSQVLPDSFPLTAGGVATNGAALRAQYLADAENVAVNYFGKIQYPDGSWRWDDWYSTGDDGSLLKGIMQPFMVGMLTRALCDLHSVTTNITVKESVKNQICKACWHLYSDGPFTKGIATHFNVEVGGFHYFYHGGTELNPARYEKGDFPFDTTVDWHVSSARQLMGTCIGSFAYAYKISGDEFFKSAGEELYKYAYSGFDGFRSMMNDTSKNFNQHVFGTSNYKAWLSAISNPLPTEPVPTQPSEPVKVPSPDGTKGTTIIDSQLATWTIGLNKETLRNGTQAGGGQGTEYKWFDSRLFVWGLDGDWYEWRNSGWLWFSKTEPGVVVQPTPQPEPQPAPVPVAPRVLRWPSGLTEQMSLIQQQGQEKYRPSGRLMPRPAGQPKGNYTEFIGF